MSGCANGIENAVVMAPNGKPSLLFQGLLANYNGDMDWAYKAYLKSHLPSFDKFRTFENTDENGELFSTVIQTELARTGLDGAQYLSRDLGEGTVDRDKKGDTPDPEKGSVMANILKNAKLILDPEVNADGSQADTYGLTSSAGGAATTFLGRVSNLIGQFSLRKSDLTDKSGKVYPTLTDAIVAREADNLFRGRGPEERLSVDNIEYNKQEYIDFKKAIYKQGQVKGDLIHALIQHQIALINGDTGTLNALKNKIAALENSSSTENGAYNWVVQKENFQAIMKNAGINIDPKIPADLRDKVYSEVSVADADMGVAGKIDTLIERPNGWLKVGDWKTGNRFNDHLGNRIMNYGSQEFNIYDNGLGRAKLQTMLYSVIIKAGNPDARFEAPVVMHIPDEFRAKSPRNAHQVEVRDYIKMIEQYYRAEQPEVYQKMIAKSPDIFNPTHYGSTTNTSFTQDMIDDKTGMRDDEMLRKYELELEQLMTSVSLRGSTGNYKAQWTSDELKKRDMLMMKVAQARTTLALPQGSSKDFEIKKFTQWLGTINDTQNPYIQAYSQRVASARLASYQAYDKVENEFNTKLQKVLNQKLGDRSSLEKAFKPIDKQKVFENLIHQEIQEDPTDGQRRVKRGLITEQDPGWSTLTAEEKDLVVYMRTNMREVFEKVMLNGSNAVVYNRNGKNYTKLDVYNDSIGAGFKMTNSFIPKMAITSSEVRWNATKNGLEGTKQYVKHEVAKRFSMFYEENVEGENQQQYGIPVKYLGTGSSIHNPDIHTSNLEIAFKGYMQHMINKEHYDTVYALGDSVKGFLELQRDASGNLINKNAAEFVGYHMHRNLVGRIDDKGDGFWRKGFRLATSSDGKDINFSPIKFMRSLNSGVAAATLWLNVPSAAKNAGQAMWAVSKDSFVNSLASTEWGGVSLDKQDMSGKNHAKAYALWMNYQKDSMLGKGKEHPMHVFTKTFRMFPEMTELGIHNREMLSDGGTALNLNHLSALYSYPEQMTTAIMAADAMMTMKIDSGAYKGQSMWDVYSNSIVVDPATGEGSYKLPDDFSRGKLRMGDGTLQELKGLNSIEVQKLHRLVQRVKGGYRQEERSMIESTAIGEMFMLFRRWLPAAIVQGFKSKQYDQSMGFLEKTDQEDVYQWQARMTEGRWRTIAGFIGQISGTAQRRGYNWADMSDLQRKNVIDGGVTLATWAVTSAIVSAMFGDSKDNDSMKKWASEMNMRIVEQWNMVAMAEAAFQSPAAITRLLEVIKGVAQLGMATAAMATDGDQKDIYTKRGDLRGANAVLKNLPVGSAMYNAEKFIDNSEYFSSGQ